MVINEFDFGTLLTEPIIKRNCKRAFKVIYHNTKITGWKTWISCQVCKKEKWSEQMISPLSIANNPWRRMMWSAHRVVVWFFLTINTSKCWFNKLPSFFFFFFSFFHSFFFFFFFLQLLPRIQTTFSPKCQNIHKLLWLKGPCILLSENMNAWNVVLFELVYVNNCENNCIVYSLTLHLQFKANRN